MAPKWIELVTGSLEQKRQYKRDRARIEALPEPYRTVAKALWRYFMYYPGITDEAADLDALLRRHTFSRRLGLKVVELGDGTCTVRVPFRHAFERPGGIVSGDVYMTAADIAFWLAIKTFAGLDDPSVTSHLNTTFLSAARREPFQCVATVLRRGRRVIYGMAQCATGKRILTHHTLTYMRPE